MKRYGILGGLVLAAAIWSLASVASAQAACTETGFFVDGTNMTAAQINPGNVTGTVDATGCNIGVYYDDGTAGGTAGGGTVNNATIGAPAGEAPNYFGIVVKW
jgi:hypothetical protein